VNFLARSAREGTWTGFGCGAFLVGLLVIAVVLIVAFSINPLLGVLVTLVLAHWFGFRFHRHRRQRSKQSRG